MRLSARLEVAQDHLATIRHCVTTADPLIHNPLHTNLPTKAGRTTRPVYAPPPWPDPDLRTAWTICQQHLHSAHYGLTRLGYHQSLTLPDTLRDHPIGTRWVHHACLILSHALYWSHDQLRAGHTTPPWRADLGEITRLISYAMLTWPQTLTTPTLRETS